MKACSRTGPGTETLPAGSVRISSDQPLGLLAAALLEPGAPDSFLAWGVFSQMLSPPPGVEDSVRAPMAEALLAQDAAVRAGFAAKLAVEPAFAYAVARPTWLNERLPGRSPFHLASSVFRER